MPLARYVGEVVAVDPESALLEVARELLGERPPMKNPSVRYEQALPASAFADVVKLEVRVERTRTIDDLIGFAYSTSFASLERVGDRREEFEQALRSRLKPVYRERISVAAYLGRSGRGDE